MENFNITYPEYCSCILNILTMDSLIKKRKEKNLAQTIHHHNSKAQHTYTLSHTRRNAEIFITFSLHSCSHYKPGSWGIWEERERGKETVYHLKCPAGVPEDAYKK